jgi:hypothetical protein
MRGRSHARSHTHRDTFAFVLAILGASLWALFPLGNLLYKHAGAGREVLPLLVAMAGACVGAWTAGTVWRRVTLATPAVAGALFAAIVVGVFDLQRCGTVSLSAVEALLVAGVALAALAGAAVGRRMREPRVSLVAAWITLGSLGISMLAVTTIDGLGYDVGENAGALLLLFGGLPGALAAMVLCEDVHRRSTAMWLILLAATAFAGTVIVRGSSEPELGDALLAGALAGGILAANVIVAHWVVYSLLWRRRSDKDVPPAQVVQR